PRRQGGRPHHRGRGPLAGRDGAALAHHEGEDRLLARLVQDPRAAGVQPVRQRRRRLRDPLDRSGRSREAAVSHFTQVETKINDLACLALALADLGIEFEEATANQLVKVRGWKGSTLTAEAKLKASKSYDVGLQLTEEGTYKLVADWWGIEEETNEAAEKIQQKVIQCYAKHKVKAEVAKQGFTLDEEQVEADGTIKLAVSKW